jgi:hypothetical protein
VFFPTLASPHRLGHFYFRQNPAGAVPTHIIDDILLRVVEAVTNPLRHKMTSLLAE